MKLCGELSPPFDSGSVNVTNTYGLPSCGASILETMKSFFIAHNYTTFIFKIKKGKK
jgi:hypothetical protein